MKWSVVLLIVLGFAGAIAAAVLVAALRIGNREIVTVKATQTEEVAVVVAAATMDPYAVVDQQSVATRQVKRDQAPPGFMASEQRVIGRLLAQPMQQGEAFTESAFIPDKDARGIIKLIRPGMRIVTVSLPRSASVGALLYPGSIVDVLASFKMPAGPGGRAEAVSTVPLEGIAVVAVGDHTVVSPEGPAADTSVGKSSPGATQTVALLVEAWQAKVLQLATQNGQVSLAMRNPTDRSPAPGGPAGLGDLFISTGAWSQPQVVGSAEPQPAGGDLQPTTANTLAATPPQTVASGMEMSVDYASKPEKRWETIIIRGGKQEIKTFPMNDEK